MNKLDKTYQDLLQDILDNGVTKQDRTGTGTISVFGRQIRHNMKDGFPLLTTKKMPWKSIVTELLWFLRGDTNIKYLVDNNCHIWDGDAHKNYSRFIESDANQNNKLEIVKIPESKEIFIKTIKCDDEIVRKMGRRYCENFAKQWGELGPIYGKQWRSWRHHYPKTYPEVSQYEQYIGVKTIDQIQNLINDLKTNPDSRRLMVNAWNVGELNQMVLPPCHYGFQVYTRELSFMERKEILRKTLSKRYPPLSVNVSMKMYEGEEAFKEIFETENIPTRAISLMFNMRSNDVPLGLPFNISSYGLLLEIIGKMVNMIPDELITNLGDAHIYKNQVDGVKEQLTREPFELPKLVMSNQINFNESVDEFLNSCLITDFIVENYQSHPTIKIPLSN